MTGLLFVLLCLCLEAHQVTTQGTMAGGRSTSQEEGTSNTYLTDQLVQALASDLPVCVKKKNDSIIVVDKSQCCVPKDCQAVYDAGHNTSGVYYIKPEGLDEMQVYCEFDDCGNWIVIQRRFDGSVNFTRNWTQYKTGFGDLNGEFWLGLEKIYQLTNAGYQKLRVIVAIGTDHEWAAYSSFILQDGFFHYELSVGGYSGTAGDSLSGSEQGWFWLTQGNPGCHVRGPWWYPMTGCLDANLNGPYGSSRGMVWGQWKGVIPLSTSTMKIKM